MDDSRPDPYGYRKSVPLAQAGDRDAWAEIIRQSAGLRKWLINHLAGETMIRRVGYEELEQVALEGVVEAVNRYDPHHPKAKPFETVLNYRVRQAVVNYVAENTGPVRLPYTAYKAVGKAEELYRDDDRNIWDIPDDELQEATGQGFIGKAARARLQPNPVEFTDENGNQDYIFHSDLEVEQDVSHVESDDYETLRMLGKLAKIEDSDERQRTAVQFCDDMGFSRDVAARLLKPEFRS